jgi:hypothetical protein
MKVKKIKEILNYTDQHDDDDLVIALAMPSMGPSAKSQVTGVSFGFDWDMGSTFITPERKLSEKTIPEDTYQMASDLLMYLATKPSKRESYETRRAKAILLRAGYKEEDFEKYRTFFHKE